MVLETKIEAKVVAGVDKGSFNKIEQTARDTGKKINQDLKVKMEVDIAKAQLKLKELRKQLRSKDLTEAQRLKLQIDTNAAQRNVTELKRRLNNLVSTGQTGVSRLQAKFNSLGKGIINSFKSMLGPLAIIGVLTTAVRGLFNEFRASADAADKFEESMSNVSTLVDTSVESMDNMGKAVLEIAKDSPKSIEELTAALYDVRSAGIGAEDAMSVLDQSAKLAVAGLGSVKEATNLMTSAFNAFSSQGYTADQIASTLFLTVKNGKTTISELSQGFGGLAGLAATLGVDFRELMAATSALTTTGQSASEAYSGLKGILTAVAKGTPKSIKAAKELGIEFSATALASKGLKGFLEDINQKLKDQGIEGPAAAEALAKVFGRVEGLNAVLSLTNANQEAFNASMIDMTTNTTAFMEAYDKQSATVEARVKKLNNELEIQRIELGNNTSAWRGFGTFLKVQFLDILNKLSRAFKVFGRTLAASFEVAGNALNETVSGIKDGISSLIKGIRTGNFKEVKLFDYNKTKASLDKLRNVSKEVNADITRKQAEEVKKRNDIEIQLEKELEKEKTKINTGSIGSAQTVQKEKDKLAEDDKQNIKDYENAVKDMTTQVGKAYDGLTSKIKKSQDAQKSLKDDLKGIDKDIASRIVEIDKKLAGTDINPAERIALQNEKSLAYKGLSQEDKTKLETQVKDIAEYEKKTEIEKLQILKTQKETALQEEITREQELVKQKEALGNAFEEYLKGKVEQEATRAEQLRQKWLAVAAARAKIGSSGTGDNSGVGARAAGGPVSAGSPYIVGERGPELMIPETNGRIIPNHNLTVNQNVNANVANGVDIDVLAQQLARKITLAGKGLL